MAGCADWRGRNSIRREGARNGDCRIKHGLVWMLEMMLSVMMMVLVVDVRVGVVVDVDLLFIHVKYDS